MLIKTAEIRIPKFWIHASPVIRVSLPVVIEGVLVSGIMANWLFTIKSQSENIGLSYLFIGFFYDTNNNPTL